MDCWDKVYSQPKQMPECDGSLPPEDMPCPGPCCWRGPVDENEQKEWDAFYDAQWKEERKKLEACFIEESDWAKEIDRAVSVPDLENMI